jgi:hypothetical protein
VTDSRSASEGSARAEAERLVAAALATLSMAARGAEGFATGSPECCVCPVCRAIAAVREPDADLAERLAGGVGDLAAGVAAVLRSLSGMAGAGTRARPGRPAEGAEPPPAAEPSPAAEPEAAPRPEPEAADRRPDTGGPDDDPWRAATRG